MWHLCATHTRTQPDICNLSVKANGTLCLKCGLNFIVTTRTVLNIDAWARHRPFDVCTFWKFWVTFEVWAALSLLLFCADCSHTANIFNIFLKFFVLQWESSFHKKRQRKKIIHRNSWQNIAEKWEKIAQYEAFELENISTDEIKRIDNGVVEGTRCKNNISNHLAHKNSGVDLNFSAENVQVSLETREQCTGMNTSEFKFIISGASLVSIATWSFLIRNRTVFMHGGAVAIYKKKQQPKQQQQPAPMQWNVMVLKLFVVKLEYALRCGICLACLFEHIPRLDMNRLRFKTWYQSSLLDSVAR